MKRFALTAIATLISISAFAIAADTPKVQLPADYSDWIHYRTSDTGRVIEEMYAPKDVVLAAKKSNNLPYGSKILLVEYKKSGGKKADVNRYIVMEKEKGWGASFPESVRNGEWEYQAYHGDKRPFTEAEDRVTRCMGCHKSTADTDYVYSMHEPRAAKVD